MKTIGVISDTHGLMRPEALEALRGSDVIVHAGDIGASEVLERLRSVAEVVAIKGNNDRAAWAVAIPETVEATIESLKVYVIHDVNDLDSNPAAAGYRVVISGHSHNPSIREKDGVLYLNPGSAGPRRFKLPIAIARLAIDGAAVKAEIIALEVTPQTKSLTSPKSRHIKNPTF